MLAAWGFTLKTVYTWAKSTRDGRGLAFGMGRLFRGCSELALVGKRGAVTPASRSERNVLVSPALPHSKKPEGLQDALDRMFPDARKLELFARRERSGWTCLGNECPATDGQDTDLAKRYRDAAIETAPCEAVRAALERRLGNS